MKKTIAGIVLAGALAFGGTADLVPVTPYMITGSTLYDTTSGTFDIASIGYYFTEPDGTKVAHQGARPTATSTLPEGIYETKDVTGLTEAHIIGTRYHFYDKDGKELGFSDDQTIAQKVKLADTPLPTINVSAASLVL